MGEGRSEGGRERERERGRERGGRERGDRDGETETGRQRDMNVVLRTETVVCGPVFCVTKKRPSPESAKPTLTTFPSIHNLDSRTGLQ